jgi:hypothetical protein
MQTDTQTYIDTNTQTYSLAEGGHDRDFVLEEHVVNGRRMVFQHLDRHGHPAPFRLIHLHMHTQGLSPKAGSSKKRHDRDTTETKTWTYGYTIKTFDVHCLTLTSIDLHTIPRLAYQTLTHSRHTLDTLGHT